MLDEDVQEDSQEDAQEDAHWSYSLSALFISEIAHYPCPPHSLHFDDTFREFPHIQLLLRPVWFFWRSTDVRISTSFTIN